MIPVLGFYLARTFLIQTLIYLAALVGIMGALDLLNNATEILERNLGFEGIVTYMMLRLPTVTDQILALAVLMATIQTFNRLARHNEVTAMRAAGITLYKMLLLLLPVASVVVMLHYVMKDTLLPYTERHLATWWQDSKLPAEEGEEKDDSIWFRVGSSIVSIKRIEEDGNRLQGITIYEREEHSFVQRIAAEKAERRNGEWILDQAIITDLRGDTATLEPQADSVWQTDITPRTILQLAAPNARLSTRAAGAALSGSAASNASPAYYRMQLYQTYALPLSSFVMLLLGVPTAFVRMRDQSAARLPLMGLVLGLLFLLTTGVLSSFGQAGLMPPLLAISASALFFLTIGLYRLILLEENV